MICNASFPFALLISSLLLYIVFKVLCLLIILLLVLKFSTVADLSAVLLLAALGSFGGDSEIRTRDPLLARQVLSQLSYTPIPKQ